ncbi:fumarate hydratase [bacterium]|nr:fumarate hydratase [bacterium]
MRKIPASQITQAVKELCLEANTRLGLDVLEAMRNALKREKSLLAREILQRIILNAEAAESENMPMCQDTGFVVVFAEIGQELCVTEGLFTDAVQEGVRQGYLEGYLRKSIVKDPFRRENTGDNTPAVLHSEMVDGNEIRLIVMPKGGGSENMSEAKVFAPSVGIEGVKTYVVDVVKRAGANPCPPVIIGIGLGGTLDQCALLSKKALLRRVGSRHPDPFYAALECDILDSLNRLDIGPQGFGGCTTALGVFIEVFPCHIASLPVAVTIQCHAARHAERRI